MSDFTKKVEEVWEKTVDTNVNAWNKVENFFVNGNGNLAKHFTNDVENVSEAKDKE
ncbi:hypothetical protein [Clostridium estertheticum]|uniref:hypothetical protein n=1 Tax=Clostridium estertheticum TaxID=238834 RepID=UPI001C0E47DC|nr:hypothetical protein [Clostridium estertheticum]MBU3074789.1 hypothetical protein [Clostridium estertheticum]MBU3165004.1 hypothetical protein [Clostridium estertheticum]